MERTEPYGIEFVVRVELPKDVQVAPGRFDLTEIRASGQDMQELRNRIDAALEFLGSTSESVGGK